MQERVHAQGFGTASVRDVLARIQDELPAVADAAGVDLIVSRWEVAFRRPSVALVDVTDALVARFDPSDETLAVIRDLRATEPLPADELPGPRD